MARGEGLSMSAPDAPAPEPVDVGTKGLAKIVGASGGGAVALVAAYHAMIVVPMLADHTSRPHPGVSAGLSDVKFNEKRMELLDKRLDRIEDKLDVAIRKEGDR